MLMPFGVMHKGDFRFRHMSYAEYFWGHFADRDLSRAESKEGAKRRLWSDATSEQV